MGEVPAHEADFAISSDHCHLLLGSVQVSRIAFVEDGRPRLVLMNHRRDGDSVLLRTSDESSLAVLTRDGVAVPALLEVDSVSAIGQFGWSVIASGSVARAGSVDPDRLPTPWRGGALNVVLRLTIEKISGLQVGPDDGR